MDPSWTISSSLSLRVEFPRVREREKSDQKLRLESIPVPAVLIEFQPPPQ